MTCTSATDKKGAIGYSYLKNEIEPSGAQKAVIYTIIFFLSSLIWGLAVFLGAPAARTVINGDRSIRYRF